MAKDTSNYAMDSGAEALRQFVADDRADIQSPLRASIGYLAARLDRLEGGQIDLSQIPISDLQNQLAVTWHPEWTQDDTDDSIMGSLIGGRRSVNCGITTATFSGSAESAVATVTHNLGDIPLFYDVQDLFSGTDRISAFMTGTGSGSFSYVMRNMTGAALTGNFSARWIAIG